MKKICWILMFVMLILSSVTVVKAENSFYTVDKEVVYFDEGYSMQITTIVYKDSQTTFATFGVV